MRPTKYGSKSSPDKARRHFFRWGEEGPGKGTGKCLYCGLRMKFKEGAGPRGGKDRFYSTDGRSWTEEEPKCVKRAVEATVAAKAPKAKKSAKKGSKRSNGTKKAAARARGTLRKSATKKRSENATMPQPEPVAQASA